MHKPESIHKSSATFTRPLIAWAVSAAMMVLPGLASGADSVKIGYLIPLSGSAAASIGRDMSRATHLAIKHINEAGGIKSMNGAKLELIEVDTRGDPKVAITETERLITREKTPVLLGAFQSGITFPATVVAEKYRTPWVVDLAAKADITERGFKYVFRPVQVPASANAESMVEFVDYANKSTGKVAKTAAILYENTDWGQDMANTLRAGFKRIGVELVLDEAYPPNTPDLRPLVLKVKGKKPDIVTATSYAADAIQLHKLFSQMQVGAMAYIGSAAGQIDSNFLPSVGKDVANNVFTTNGWAGYESAITTPFAKRFWDEFVAAYKVDPNELSVSAYGAAWVVKDAIERAGKAEPEAIRDALATTKIENTDLTKLLGYDIVIDAKGQNVKKRYVMQQISDGKYRTIWPENVAAADYKMTWPAGDAK